MVRLLPWALPHLPKVQYSQTNTSHLHQLLANLIFQYFTPNLLYQSSFPVELSDCCLERSGQNTMHPCTLLYPFGRDTLTVAASKHRLHELLAKPQNELASLERASNSYVFHCFVSYNLYRPKQHLATGITIFLFFTMTPCARGSAAPKGPA